MFGFSYLETFFSYFDCLRAPTCFMCSNQISSDCFSTLDHNFCIAKTLIAKTLKLSMYASRAVLLDTLLFALLFFAHSCSGSEYIMTDGDGQKQKKCVHTSNIGECGVQTRKRKTKCDPITKMINEKKKKIQKAKQKDAIAHEKRRAAMSPEERNQAKKKNATANEKRRAAMSPEERNQAKKKNALQMRSAGRLCIFLSR